MNFGNLVATRWPFLDSKLSKTFFSTTTSTRPIG
jgi:hypothetical protein